MRSTGRFFRAELIAKREHSEDQIAIVRDRSRDRISSVTVSVSSNSPIFPGLSSSSNGLRWIYIRTIDFAFFSQRSHVKADLLPVSFFPLSRARRNIISRRSPTRDYSSS